MLIIRRLHVLRLGGAFDARGKGFAAALAFIAAIAVAGGFMAAARADAPLVRDDVFRDQVAPILARHCAACHGPATAESGLRIDVREQAMAGGDSGSTGIVPGQPDASEILVRIEATDAETRMPADAEPLSPDERALIRAWIAAGAHWPDNMRILPAELLPEGGRPARGTDHWAFQPLTRPPVPAPAAHASTAAPGTWANPIDAFIADTLERRGLDFNPPAEPRALLRRVTFHLMGLPPTPEVVDAFVAACDAVGLDAAYTAVVDRLLASPHHGERWARHWLDVVRFAESDGFETNRARANAWPYRDWVIEALNADMPFDRFVREQLCGDRLGADAATGFLVGGPVDRVKSPDPVLTANQRADELHDIVSTTSSAFLGITVGCARCHDHKFDPVPQADYYRVKAVFAGVRHGERAIRPPDDAARLARIAVLERELEPVVRRLAELQPPARLGRTIVIDDLTVAATEKLAEPRGVATHASGSGRGQADEPGGSDRLPNLGRQYHWWQPAPGQPVFAYAPRAAGTFRIWISWGAGWKTHAPDTRYVLDADGDVATADDRTVIATVDQRHLADGDGAEPPGTALWSGFRDAGVHDLAEATRLFVVAGDEAAPVTADVVLFEEEPADADRAVPTVPHLRSAVVTGANVDAFPPVEARFVRFTVRGTSSAEPCIDELEVLTASGRNVARGATPTASGTYANNPSHKLAHVNDGVYGNQRSWISDTIGGGWVQLELPETETVSRVVWSRDRSPKPKYKDRLATDYEIAVSRDGTAWTTVASSADRLPHDYVHPVGPITAAAGLSPNERAELESLEDTAAGLRKRLADLKQLPQAYAGQFTTAETVHRLFRGDPMAPREAVAPGGLAHFGTSWELPADAPEHARREALAGWIVAPDNPLTARVIVNRLWHYHFGTGIVDTPSDFGVNGGPPSHPALLDWLASELLHPADTADRWRLKRLHRLIVTSRTYRQSSAARDDALALDSGSRLLWRFPPRRLEAEPLRDAILAVSGSLDTTMGGPGFDLFEPNTNYVKVYVTKTTFGPAEFRRMVYQAKPRAELDDFFGTFDCPDAGQVQPARTASTTPLQALNMLNGEFLLDQAARFAARLEREAGVSSDLDASQRLRQRVARGFLLAFGRPADDAELAAGTALAAAHGLPIFCRALYNANEFLTVH